MRRDASPVEDRGSGQEGTLLAGTLFMVILALFLWSGTLRMEQAGVQGVAYKETSLTQPADAGTALARTMDLMTRDVLNPVSPCLLRMGSGAAQSWFRVTVSPLTGNQSQIIIYPLAPSDPEIQSLVPCQAGGS